jgi:GNAT superfamily N-acetyltransferase
LGTVPLVDAQDRPDGQDDRRARAVAVQLDVVDPRSPIAVAALGLYFAELDARFPGGFDPGDALSAEATAMSPPGGAFVVAADGRRPAACGGLVANSPTTAEIKRMWVSPDWRGEGLGRRMLARLEGAAVELGYHRIVLDTNAELTEAVALYDRAGYLRTERYNDNPYAAHWFAKDLG